MPSPDERWGSVIEPECVYAHPDGVHYVACFFEGDGWVAWPAELGGWASRRRCHEDLAQMCDELPADLARLALRLSGVPTDAAG